MSWLFGGGDPEPEPEPAMTLQFAGYNVQIAYSEILDVEVTGHVTWIHTADGAWISGIDVSDWD